ncbi:hypothetical protein DYH09_30555 [bacterium CPR1]|nr:hypothetical protein [bacterium CPR1]
MQVGCLLQGGSSLQLLLEPRLDAIVQQAPDPSSDGQHGRAVFRQDAAYRLLRTSIFQESLVNDTRKIPEIPSKEGGQAGEAAVLLAAIPRDGHTPNRTAIR